MAVMTGVVIVGEVPNTTAPVPVDVITGPLGVETETSDGSVTNTSLVPALKLTNDPALLEDSTVFLARVVPAEVYVPIPTSHSEPVCPAMQ